MSGLWTPGGDPGPSGPGASGPGPGGQGTGGVPPDEPPEPTASPEEVAAMRELHARLVATPVLDVIVNHTLGIWQLGLVHLGVVTPPDEGGTQRATGTPSPDLASAGLAIDALAALVDGLGVRLGDSEPVLREALSQSQQLYVELADQQSPSA